MLLDAGGDHAALQQPVDRALDAGAVGVEFATLYNQLGVKVTLLEALDRLVPLEDEEGAIAPGEVLDVSDEKAAAWRAAGKVTLIEDEERNAKAAAEGHYGDMTGRADVATPQSSGHSGGPQDEDEDKPRKGKK